MEQIKAMLKYAGMLQDYYPKAIAMSYQKNKDLGNRLVMVDPDFLAHAGAAGLRVAISEGLPINNILPSIGRTVLNHLGIRFDNDNDETRTKARIGWHVLYPLKMARYIKYELEQDKTFKEKDRRPKYRIKIVNSKNNLGGFVDQLIWESRINVGNVNLITMPQFDIPVDYEGFYNEEAGALIPKCNKKVIPHFTYENCPKVFDAVNRHQQIPYKIYQDSLDVIDLCHADPIWTFSDKVLTKEQRAGKVRERNEVVHTARYIGDRVFREYINLDFRGRFFPVTHYLNHSGNKMAKSFITLANAKPVTEIGIKWMKFSVANRLGKYNGVKIDKLPIAERIEWVDGNLDMLLKVGRDPLLPENKAVWQKASEPEEFLTTIMEFAKMMDSDDPEAFVSGLPVSIDATCSGLQILAFLIRCVKSGELCNLVPSNDISDFYLFIADYIYKNFIEIHIDNIIDGIIEKGYTEEELKIFNTVNRQLRRFSVDISNAPKKDVKHKKVDVAGLDKRINLTVPPNNAICEGLVGGVEDFTFHTTNDLIPNISVRTKTAIKAERKSWTSKNTDNIEIASRVFWARPEISAAKRSVCKRGCMTYFYSCGDVTMAEQLKRDFAPEKEFSGLNFYYCQWLTAHIFNACQTLMPGPTKLMELFIKLAKIDEGNNEDFHFITNYSNFLMMHNYKEDNIARMEFSYNKKSDMTLSFITNQKDTIDSNKVESASSPNVVHALDAQMVVGIQLLSKEKDYEVVSIHDCFATVPADAEKLYHDIRTVFVETLDGALEHILKQKGLSLESEGIEMGELQNGWVLENEYAFS